MVRIRHALIVGLLGALGVPLACGGTLELDPIAGDWRLDEVTGNECTATGGTLTIQSDLTDGRFEWQAICMGGVEMSEIADVMAVDAQAGMGQYTVDLVLTEGNILLRWDCTVTENTQTMDCQEAIGNNVMIFKFSRP